MRADVRCIAAIVLGVFATVTLLLQTLLPPAHTIWDELKPLTDPGCLPMNGGTFWPRVFGRQRQAGGVEDPHPADQGSCKGFRRRQKYSSLPLRGWTHTRLWFVPSFSG